MIIEFTLSKTGQSKSQYLNYVPFHLNHFLNSEFGVLKVVDPQNNKPVPKVYMKCFAKFKDGKEAFYKDGFTDIRGSFDYVSLNRDTLDDIEKFKIIVISQQFGCKLVESEPPKSIGRVEGKAK